MIFRSNSYGLFIWACNTNTLCHDKIDNVQDNDGANSPSSDLAMFENQCYATTPSSSNGKYGFNYFFWIFCQTPEFFQKDYALNHYWILQSAKYMINFLIFQLTYRQYYSCLFKYLSGVIKNFQMSGGESDFERDDGPDSPTSRQDSFLLIWLTLWCQWWLLWWVS